MGRFWRTLAATILSAMIAAPAAAQTQGGFDSSGWISDLEQLRDAMSARYPNLEWAAARGLDLPATYEAARRGIAAAQSDSDARLALERFLSRFGDGHLYVDWPRVGGAAESAPAPLCQRLGYFDLADARAVATRLPGFKAVGAPRSPFPAGVVETDGRRVGVLRLPMFAPQGFPQLCDRLSARLELSPEAPCDDACRDRLDRLADAEFARELQAQLEAVAAARPDALLIDVAANGGGNDSPLVLARMVTDRPLRAARAGFIRTAQWEAQLANKQDAVRAGLRTARGAERDELTGYDVALSRARAEALRTCERSPLWRGEPIGCSGVVTAPLFAAGLTAEPWRTSRDRAWSEVVSAIARFPGVETVWRGPLMVLVDENSASSTELFAAMMQDNRAALILGAPTAGAGCGAASGAGPVVLKHSGAKVFMPDCVRLRADGSNEVAGVEPDVLIGFRPYDTPKQRAERLARVLSAAMDRAIAGP